MIAKNGHFKINIDFEEIQVSTPALLCVFPQQVHHIIEVENPEGWIVRFEGSLIDPEILQFP